MQNVNVDRHKFVGGSDIPIILGLSPFKSRFDLLLEKAQLVEKEFVTNEYIDYGNEMEEKIRSYINEKHNTNYEENKVIKGKVRYHSDGFNGESVIEIKTTSKIRKTLKGYKSYLVQLLIGMKLNKIDRGLLVVYERPKDFNTDIQPERIQKFEIDINDHLDLLKEIEKAILKFLEDLEKVKVNPLIEEWELDR